MPLSAELVCVDPSRVYELWPTIAPLVRKAIAKANISAFADIESDILQGCSLVWLAWSDRIEAVATTALYQADNGKVCVVTACSGSDMARWIPLLDKIEQYAKDEGCQRTRIFGRKGWLRVLNGYRTKFVMMEKEL